MKCLSAALSQDPALLDERGPGGQTPLMNAVLSGKETATKRANRV